MVRTISKTGFYARHHPRISFRRPFERHGLDHGGDVAHRTESERRIARPRRARQGAVDAKLLEEKLERRHRDRFIGRTERNHHATAPQAAECSGHCLAARRRGQHDLCAAKLLQLFCDVGGGALFQIVMRAQLFREDWRGRLPRSIATTSKPM